MSNINNLLIEELREHQKKRPDEPHDVDPMWYHNQYEKWQRIDDSLRLILGARLVEDVLNEENETALPTRDEIAGAIADGWNSVTTLNATAQSIGPSAATDAVLSLLKGQDA